MKEGRKPEYPEKTPGDELQKMQHSTARRFEPQARLEPAQWHWWHAKKADMLTVTPRVAPKNFGLPPSVTCPVNRNAIDQECLLLVLVSKGFTSLL